MKKNLYKNYTKDSIMGKSNLMNYSKARKKESKKESKWNHKTIYCYLKYGKNHGK